MAGFAAVAVVVSTPDGPVQPVMPVGAEASGPLTALATFAGLDGLSASALGLVTIAAMVLAIAGFLLVVRAAWRGEVSAGWVLGLAAAYHLVVLFLPLLGSRDVFSYAMYGRIASVYRANPYVLTPADFPSDPWFGFIGPKWAGTPAVYGPGFTAMSSLVTRVAGEMWVTLLAFRVIVVAASLATVAIAARLAGQLRPARRAFAAAMIGLNPVVLFMAVAGDHNDVLLGLAVIGALALLASRRPLLATAMLTLGMLVKAPAALPLLLCIVVAVASEPSARRVRTLLAHLGLVLGLVALVAAAFLQTEDPSLGLVELSGHTGWLAVSSTVARLTRAGGSGDPVAVAVRVACSVVLVGIVAGIAVRLGRRAALRGSVDPLAQGAGWGWSLLALTLLAPVLLPWYLAWSLPLAWLLPRTPRIILLVLSSLLSLTHLVALPSRFPVVYDATSAAGRWLLAPAIAGLLVWLLLDLGRRFARGAPLEHDEQQVPAHAD